MQLHWQKVVYKKISLSNKYFEFLELTNSKKSKEAEKNKKNSGDDEDNEMAVDEDKEKEGTDEEDEDAVKEKDDPAAEKSAAEKEVVLREGLIKVANLLVEKNLKDAVALAFDLTKKYDVRNVFGYT